MGTTKRQTGQDTGKTTEIHTAPEKLQSTRERHGGPVRAQRSSSPLPPPNGTPPAARAGEMLVTSPELPQASKRAQMSAAIQRQVGNSRTISLLGGLQKQISAGELGDHAEHEADDAASPVVSGHKVARISRVAVGRRSSSRQPGAQEGGMPVLPPLRSSDGAFQAKSRAKTDSSGVHAQAAQGLSGSWQPLPQLEQIQASFGEHDVTGVQAHTGGVAGEACDALGAQAYATGNAVAFKSTPSLHTAAHEAAHVVQQRSGVQLKDGIGRDGDAYERHADAVADRVVQGKSAEGLLSRVPGGDGASPYLQRQGADQTVADEGLPSGTLEQDYMADAETISPEEEPLQQSPEGSIQGRKLGAVQMDGGKKRSKDKTVYVPYKIEVGSALTTEQFRVLAMKQIFGAAIQGIEWGNSKPSYTPDKSPYTLLVDIKLLNKHRGSVNAARGFDVDVTGGIKGAKERAKAFQGGAESEDKSALMSEIDRRYYAAAGVKPGTKIKRGEKGRAAMWRQIRDEVLFQHEYVANLPPQVKKLIKYSIKGRELTPADYDKLFDIAKKIEKMPPGEVSDYASKVTGSTTDLDKFEASLDRYLAERALRRKEGEDRDKIQTKLIGLEAVYKKYKLYKTLLKSGSMGAIPSPYSAGAGLGTALAAGRVRKELEADLKAHGFAGVAEFEAYIKKFEKAFEREAAHIAKDLLEKYAGKLYRESERYKDPAEISILYRKLSGVRAEYKIFETNAKVWNDYAAARQKARQQARIPGQGHVRTSDYTSITKEEAEAAREKAQLALSVSESAVKGMSGEHPVFQEEGLPLDKRINKVALAKASEKELGGVLQGYIQTRMKAVGEARAELEGKPELIYKMDKLMPQFYAQQGIRPGSIHDMIIRDKMRSDAIRKLLKGILLAIVAIALAVVSFGTATPAIIAGGAAIAGAGLGVYMALEEYQEYVEQQKLADVGLADDPSVVWLVIAVVGAVIDVAAAVKAVKALGPAAKAFNSTGDLAAFNKTVKALEEARQIEAKVARAAERAAAARKGFAEASKELTKAMAGKLYSFPGPLADPDVYKAVVKMARQAIKTKLYDAQKFIEELKLARIRAGFGDLTPEELAKAKQAWEEAKVLEAAEGASRQKLLLQISDVTKLEALIAKAGDAVSLERLLKVFPEAELETIFAKLTDTRRLVVMIDHLGGENSAKMIRQWMAKGKFTKMNEFLERLAGGAGKELAETAAVGAKSVIIDSQTAIALAKDAKGLPLQAGEQLMVRYVKSLPAGTELRVGNVTVGEVGSSAVSVKGLPIDVARNSPAYKSVLSELETLNVGGGKGAADRALVADAFFAKTEPGVIPKFATADKNVFNKLATKAGIDLKHMGGKTLSQLHPGGFEVTVAGQKLHVVPIEP